jgi:orotate phosphoribosyltransferase
MTSDEILDLFRRRSALLEGHFRLSSGLHSSGYLQCALVLQYPGDAAALGAAIADRVRPLGPDVVLSPALGGVVIGHEVARALGAPFLFTERDPQTRKMVLRRGFTVHRGESAVVIEDVITTGGSTRDVIECLRAAGARVLAAGSIIDRSGGTADVGVPRVALATLQVAAHQPDTCPLCREGVPVVKPGSRPE